MAEQRFLYLLAVTLSLLAGCGGGGSAGTSAPSTASANGGSGGSGGGIGGGLTQTQYANSVGLGSWTAQTVTYTAASSTIQAVVTTSTALVLLPKGATTLVAEHVEAALPGLREVCVSDSGESTNVISPINLGVIAKSVAVLLDAGWNPVAAQSSAWTALAQRHAVLMGWENCGVKPEGAPSPSSLLTAQSDGSYTEDVYDGNPGTTFNVISQVVPAAQMTAMLTDSGYATTDDPSRPMQLYWRLFADGAGRQALIEIGLPRSSAPQSLKGFIALYIPSP